MTKIRTITDLRDIQQLRARIRNTADIATTVLKDVLAGGAGLNVLRAIRFEPIGRDPLDGNRRLNLVEQVNQTFTYLATLDATEWLLEKHRDLGPFIVNLGTASGWDISSAGGNVVAEVFAAVTPRNNRKLNKDIAKVARAPGARHRYVFFACPGNPSNPVSRSVDGVFVMTVPLRTLC